MKKSPQRFEDLLLGVVFAAISVAYYYGASKLPPSKLFKIGADFMPKIYAVCLFIVSIAFIIFGIHNVKDGKEPRKKTEDFPVEYGRVTRVSLVFIAYALCWKPVGFVVSTAVFLIVEMFLFAPDNKKTSKDALLYVLISIVTTAVLFYAFRNGFHILLPVGILKI